MTVQKKYYGPWRRDPDGYWVFVDFDYDITPRYMGGVREMLAHLSSKPWFTPRVRMYLIHGLIDYGEITLEDIKASDATPRRKSVWALPWGPV